MSELSRSRVRYTRIVMFLLLVSVAAFGVMRSLNSTAKAMPSRFSAKARKPGKNGAQDTQKTGKADESQSIEQRGAEVQVDERHDLSPPLFAIPPAPRATGHKTRDHEKLPRPTNPNRNDPVAQTQPATALAPTTTFNFDGVGNGFSGPQGNFTVNSAPPDTNGDVGPNHYVQIVNTDFAIFNKSGTVLYGPVPINTLWSGFGGGCQTNNDGDPVVLYDSISDRWVISQFSVSTTPYLQCVAVSQTGDPTGAYYRYSFNYGNTDFPDYPKMGVWSDGYYITFNIFANGSTFSGSKVCSYDRTKMLFGLAATQQCFNTSSQFGGLLPADLDGSQQPPAGSTNYVVSLGSAANQLAFWKFHVDWTTPGNSTFTGPSTLATANFTEACNGGTCIPQSGTTRKLDSLADRLMFRLAYRNLGDHEALVVNHSVTSGTSTGVRWYELRPDPNHNLSIFQQGTYAPDSNYRWMGSVAMDQSGNIGLGFSLSGSSIHPQIHYTGRLASSPAGQMDQGEASMIDGAGSQTGTLSRWGDYSMLGVDPSDDCTFWYTNEYIPNNGTFNWKTRIASFKFPGCGTATNDFSISASPSSQSVVQGNSTSYNVSTSFSGPAQTVTFSVSGLPAGASASFNPASVNAGGSSTLTIATGTASIGTYPLTITGTYPGGTPTHSTSVQLVITAPVTNDFSISASPSSLSLAQGSSGSSTISTALVSGSAETINLSVSGAPTGVTAGLNPTTVNTGGSSTLTVNVGSSTATGTYTLTVQGSAASATHSRTVSLTVTAPSSQLLLNPGFESGNVNWITIAGVISNSGRTPHSGSWFAWLDGYGTTHTDTCYQQITIPSAATSATLSFYLSIDTAETTTTIAYDKLQVQIRNSSNTLLATLATYSNLNKTNGYVLKTFDVSAYRGQTIRVYFLGTEDSSLQTSFVIDDTAVKVQ